MNFAVADEKGLSCFRVLIMSSKSISMMILTLVLIDAMIDAC